MIAPYFYRDNELSVEEVTLADIAEKEDTPCYVYSSAAILSQYRAYDQAFGTAPHQVCFAVKANSNLSILRMLAKAGAGFDIVSGGELFRVLRAGGDPAKVVFSGVGKSREEVEYAITNGIHSFNCESEAELALINSIASRHSVFASVALRVNPNVDAKTHPYISTGLHDHKFGINIDVVKEVYDRAAALQHLRLTGVSCHIGSQLLDTNPLFEALDGVLTLVEKLRAAGHPITELDMGGGLGVAYSDQQTTPSVQTYIKLICEKTANLGLKLMVEPGRSIAAAAGVLVSRVMYRKTTANKEFVIVDAAMNDLIRPSLYQAHHEILPLRQRSLGTITADVVGPVCESGDYFARDRQMANVFPGDYVALMTAGAYGFVQASNYNSRPRACEVLVEGKQWRVIRQRETLEDLVQGE